MFSTRSRVGRYASIRSEKQSRSVIVIIIVFFYGQDVFARYNVVANDYHVWINPRRLNINLLYTIAGRVTECFVSKLLPLTTKRRGAVQVAKPLRETCVKLTRPSADSVQILVDHFSEFVYRFSGR